MRVSLVLPIALTCTLTGALAASMGCSIMVTRPIQEMSDTSAAIRAAREVQADTLAPDLFRESGELFIKAKNEYKFKNFDLAKEYADRSRALAEQAEFEAIHNGATRVDPNVPSDPMANSGAPEPAPTEKYDYPKPTGTPVDAYEQRKQAEQAAQQPPAAPPGAAPAPAPAPTR